MAALLSYQPCVAETDRAAPVLLAATSSDHFHARVACSQTWTGMIAATGADVLRCQSIASCAAGHNMVQVRRWWVPAHSRMLVGLLLLLALHPCNWCFFNFFNYI